MQIYLHYIPRYFSESFHISWSTIDKNIPACLTGPDKTKLIKIGYTRYSIRVLFLRLSRPYTYLKPARTFNKVDFPAPDGPRMAVN